MKKLFTILAGLLLCCCMSVDEKEAYRLVDSWVGKEILFPSGMQFSNKESNNVDFDVQSPYKILVYVDSTGCISCKLKLAEWKVFMRKTDSIAPNLLRYVFVFVTKNNSEAIRALKVSNFTYPVCLDEDGVFDKLNHFPLEMEFQTFLLDRNNRVLAMGNPVLNPHVRDLYWKLLRGESIGNRKMTLQTTVSVSSAEADLGTFPWQELRTCTFTLRNTGDRPLVIHDVTTSCGCLTVDYPEEPARPGEELTLRAHYRADSRGTVLKSMQVYCNAQGSPLRLRVTGTAE